MKIGIPKENKNYENRVSLTPDVIKSLKKNGFDIIIEADAGKKSNFSDVDYTSAGAEVASQSQVYQADIVLKVNAPTLEEAQMLKDGSVLISYLYAYTIPEVIDLLCQKKISAFSMDAVPRISKAQPMDALSSQTNGCPQFTSQFGRL
ncbi:MAG: hypothetical protein MUF45_19185 [Spirosomaceae bacterium]|nr:hypothetical protein [Spirosomataceae bacterium]